MTSLVRYGVLALLAGGLLPVAEARAETPRFEVTPFFGARLGGQFDVATTTGEEEESVDLDAGTGFGFDLGLYRDATGYYELLYSRQGTSLDSDLPALQDVDIDVHYLHFGGTLLMPREDNWLVPYLSLTIGATLLEPQQGGYDSETKFSASLGGGLRVPFNDNVFANLGLRGYLTFVESDTDLFCLSGPSGGSCLLRSSGSTFMQGEASIGITVRF